MTFAEMGRENIVLFRKRRQNETEHTERETDGKKTDK